MRILFDTNVILDVLLERADWYADGFALWNMTDEGRIDGFITASTVTDIFYLARKLKGRDAAFQAIGLCLESFELLPVDRAAVETALEMGGADFEDNLQISCAVSAQLDCIVTRNGADFSNSPVTVRSPRELLSSIERERASEQ